MNYVDTISTRKTLDKTNCYDYCQLLIAHAELLDPVEFHYGGKNK